MTEFENGFPINYYLFFTEVFYNILRQNRDDILEFERSHLIDETKRPGKSKDLFGIQGSFKKLDID